MKSDVTIDISHCTNHKQILRKIKRLSVECHSVSDPCDIIYAKITQEAYTKIKMLDPKNIIISYKQK